MLAYRLACIALAALALATWVWALSPEPATPADGEVPAGDVAARVTGKHIANAAVDPAPAREAAPAPAAGARSLTGTEVDGQLSRDAAGRFVPDREAIRLFDYFLSAEGEEEPAAIRAHVQAAARARLPYDEAARALALYDRYLAYRAALQSAFAAATPTGDPAQALLLAEHAQVTAFGTADAERLFAADNTAAAAAFATMAGRKRPSDFLPGR